MARKVFPGFEAVSAMVPTEGGYHAAIAVKAAHGPGAPRFHKVLDAQVFPRADAADAAAAEVLERLAGVDEEGGLVWGEGA